MILTLKVKPNSRIDKIFYDTEGNLNVKIMAQPIDEANYYLIDNLSYVFEVPKSQILLLKGTTNQYKKIEIVSFEEKITSILHKIKKLNMG